MPTLSSACDFMMALANPSRAPNLKSLAQPLQKYYRRTPKFWEAPLAQGYPTFSTGCDFMIGLGKPQLYIKVQVASFS